jgi:hypothetical protein
MPTYPLRREKRPLRPRRFFPFDEEAEADDDSSSEVVAEDNGGEVKPESESEEKLADLVG